MRKTVLIVEDNVEQAKALKQLVKEVNENTEVCTADCAADAYRFLMEKTVDVFLVDIVLDAKIPGDASGIRLVEKLRKIQKYFFTPVIFITSLEDKENYSYRSLNCLGYIEKPYDSAQVKEKVERALYYTTQREKDSVLSFRKDGIFYPVKLKDVVYFESLGHVLYVHLSDGEVLEIPYRTCRGILREEDVSGRLLQCSRGVLVNREYVRGLDTASRYVMLKGDNKMLTVGSRYKKNLIKELSE